MKKLWSIRPANPELASSLAKDFSVSLPIAQLLVHRGLTEAVGIRSFLEPRLKDLQDPFLLPDMDRAVDRVLRALVGGEKIIVFGDYDVDGMTSIALLLDVLGAMGANCGYYLPSRFTDGYGLKKESIARCVQEGARLIISVDCGTNSSEEILFAKSQGVDMIILDHHEHNGVPLEALATVNPKRKESRYQEELSSVGISFKFAHALLKRCREMDNDAGQTQQGQVNAVVAARKIDLKKLLDFVAIGTIADMVPLLGENRILVTHGLGQLAQTQHPGLRILRDLAGGHESLRAADVAFRIVPRLNANGRLSDAQDALALLCTPSETQAMALAQKLHQENMRRQQIEKQTSQEAIAMVRSHRQIAEQPVLVVYHPQWHIGVVGIVASRLQKEFSKPAIVIGKDNGVGKGSARAPKGFNLAEALASVGSELLASGGHAAAAGLTIDPLRVDSFRLAINRYASTILASQTGPHRLDLDMELDKDQLDEGLVHELDRLEPFGMGNPRPLFATHRITVEGLPRTVGSSHLKFQTRIKENLLDVMGFRMVQEGMGEQVRALAGRKLDIAHYPSFNYFQGKQRLQLVLEDYRFSN